MRVLVLCGGRSAERDISCVSAAAVLRNLDRRRHRPILVRIDPLGRWTFQRNVDGFARHPKPFLFRFDAAEARLEQGPRPALVVGAGRLRVDAVFPVLHGPLGEDGALQGLLELAGLPYVGCGVLGSAVGMDKLTTKRLAEWAGLPVLPYAAVESAGSLAAARRLGLPVFVKPSRMGSSIGVSKVKKPAELAGAVRAALRFDTVALVEKGIDAREIECAMLGDGAGAKAARVVGEIRPNAEFYSYEAKYLDPAGADLLIPAELPAARAAEARSLAGRAFRALGGYGLARVDFLMDRRTGKLWFNEVNTMPGFTSVSMYPKLWEASGLPFARLVDRLLALAVERRRARARLRTTRD